MKNTTTIKVPKKYQHMIDEVFRDSDGYWSYAATGFYFAGMDYAVHSAVEDNQKALLDQIKTLTPCDCEECK